MSPFRLLAVLALGGTLLAACNPDRGATDENAATDVPPPATDSMATPPPPATDPAMPPADSTPTDVPPPPDATTATDPAQEPEPAPPPNG